MRLHWLLFDANGAARKLSTKQKRLSCSLRQVERQPRQHEKQEADVLQISNVSRILCGVILITVPTIEYGGAFLLGTFRKPQPYMENPLRQSLFRAGHAHAGVLVILSLICQVLVDSIILPAPLEWIARLGAPIAAILIPAGFFFSVIPPKVERPTSLIALTYVGAAMLAVGILILGIGLVHAGVA